VYVHFFLLLYFSAVNEFKQKDLVWVKEGRWPYWPALVSKRTKNFSSLLPLLCCSGMDVRIIAQVGGKRERAIGATLTKPNGIILDD